MCLHVRACVLSAYKVNMLVLARMRTMCTITQGVCNHKMCAAPERYEAAVEQ